MGAARYDFFVSYTQDDRAWAEWIAYELEAAGYRCLYQPWDMRAGSHFVEEMHEGVQKAARLVAVLSRAYQESEYCRGEWQAFYTRDASGAERRILPLRVEDCRPEGLLTQVVYVDLIGRGEAEARSLILGAAFGPTYRRYKASVPRWLPRWPAEGSIRERIS